MRVKNRCCHQSPTKTGRRARGQLRTVWLAILIMLSAGALKAAWPTAVASGEKKASGGMRSRYVAIPPRADTDLRRRGAFLARKLNLPLIAESDVTGVLIREFRK